MLGLVEAPLGEADRERLHLLGREQVAHEGDDGARVDAAAEEGSQRHVAHEAEPDGLAQALLELVDDLTVRSSVRAVEVEVPVRLDRRSSLLPDEPVARRELADPREDGVGGGHVLEREVVLEGRPVELSRTGRVLEERLQLGAEQQRAVELGVVQRLLAEPVPCEQQAPPPRVPDGEGEHPVQALRAVDARLLVEMDERLRVAVRAEDVSAGLQLRAQVREVVDLAVQHRPHGLVLVGERLPAAGSRR